MSGIIDFSLYKDEDYDGFYACINDFYSGGYPYEEYLDRENLRKLTGAGDIVITIGKDESGRIVGTSAALRMKGRFAGSVLLLLRSVIHGMRGMGIGTKQELFLLEQIRLHFPNTLSLYADVMTHDDLSQTTMLHRGFALCGFRMTLYKNEIIVPKLKYAEGTKMTQAVYCKNTGGVTRRSLFAPEDQYDILKTIYTTLGVSLDFCDDGPCRGESMYELEISSLHQKAELFVDKHGYTKNYIGEIKALLSSGYTAVAYINMSCSGCTEAYAALRESGFTFSGVKPLSESGEYLILSHRENCVFVPEYIKIPKEEYPVFETVVKELSQ